MTSDEIVEKAAQAVADEFYSMQGGDPSWPEAPKFNGGDHAIACAVLDAVADDLRAEGRAERLPSDADLRAALVGCLDRMVCPWDKHVIERLLNPTTKEH